MIASSLHPYHSLRASCALAGLRTRIQVKVNSPLVESRDPSRPGKRGHWPWPPCFQAAATRPPVKFRYLPRIRKIAAMIGSFQVLCLEEEVAAYDSGI